MECSDVRVYAAVRDRLELAAPGIYTKPYTGYSDVNLAPGEQQTFISVWDYVSSEPMAVGPSVQIFVEYTTPDGVNCVQLLSPQTVRPVPSGYRQHVSCIVKGRRVYA
jgi:hypothetical protein